jgi:copper chaperone CopZ
MGRGAGSPGYVDMEGHTVMASAKVRLNTLDMHCQSCSMLVQMTVEELGGIESVTSDYASGITDVCYDPDQVTVDEIIGAIVGAGYRANVAE